MTIKKRHVRVRKKRMRTRAHAKHSSRKKKEDEGNDLFAVAEGNEASLYWGDVEKKFLRKKKRKGNA